MQDAASAKEREHERDLLREELLRLALPPLADASFLEIGCGTGFFCGFAWFEGAQRVLGLDAEEKGLARARARFPHCSFRPVAGNLAKVLAGDAGFDVILCSSVPASLEMASFLPLLMAALKPRGTLILKVAMTEQKIGEGTSLARGAYAPLAPLPVESGMAAALDAYVFKDMGESVFTGTHGGKTHILHVRNRSPYAILLMGDSGSGKTTVARKLFAGVPVIHGDTLLRQIAELPPGTLRESHPQLNDICAGRQNTLSVGGIMIQIFNSAAGKQYARLVAEIAGGNDFVYEGVIHRNFQHVFIKQLEMLGYAVLTVDTPAPENAPRQLFDHARKEERKYGLYLESLRQHAG